MKSVRTRIGLAAVFGFSSLAVLSVVAATLSQRQLTASLLIEGHTYQLPVTRANAEIVLPDGRTLTIDGDKAVALLGAGVTRKTIAMPEVRRYASVTLMPSGQVLVWGGLDQRGHVLKSGVWFEPAADRFVSAGFVGLPGRAGQTMTVLTSGKVLVSGGWRADGNFATDALIWDPLHRVSESVAGVQSAPRALAAARLQADGAVVISGGVGMQGGLAPGVWRYISPDEGDAHKVDGSSGVVATYPKADASAASIHGPLAIRFANDVDVYQLASGTVTLLGPEGIVKTHVIGVDEGRLAFVQLPDDLYPGARYTLFVKGLHTRDGKSLPFKAIGFTTEHSQSMGVVMAGQGHRPYPKTTPKSGSSLVVEAGGGSETCRDPAHLCRPKSFIQDGAWYPGADNLPNATGAHWRLYRPHQSLPDTSKEEASLAKGATAIVGQVRQIDETPVAGVEVSMGAAKTRTDAHGVFVLSGIPGGHQPLFVDGRTASHGTVTYGRFLVGVDVRAKRVAHMPYIMYLPRVLPRDEVTLPSPTDRETVLTHPDMPGLELHIPAGTVFKDRNGHVLTHIAIVPTPVDHAPFPLPDNFPMYFTIQPGDAVVQGLTTEAAKGIRVVYPNYGHDQANTQANFWVYSTDNGWQMYGEGHVTKDRKHLAPDPGVSLVWALGAGASISNASPSTGKKPNNSCAADPVDLQTGEFFERKNDLSIRDIVPLNLMRAYSSADATSHMFGVGSTSNFGLHLYSADSTFQHPQLVLPCGEGISYDLISGAATWPFPAGTVWVHSGTSSAFYGSTLQFLYDSTPDGAHWVLTFKDGRQYAFSRHVPNSLAWIQDRFGNRLQLFYNGGLLDQVVSPSGRSITFNSDSGNRISAATDNTGRAINYAYNASGSLATVTYPDQTTEKYTYDANKRLLTVENRRGIVAVTNHYNTDGRVDIQTYADQSSYQFSYAKDSSGAVTSTEVTDPNGHVQRVVFDPTSHYPASVTQAYGTSLAETTTFSRESSGLADSVTDALGRRTDFSYDALGNVTRLTRLAGTANAVSYGFTYTDDYNQLASTTDPLGHTTQFAYTNGCLTGITDALGHTTAVTCNGAGQPTAVTDALGHTTTLTYDGYDLQSATDPMGRTTSYVTDALGRPFAAKDPSGNVTLALYDVDDRVSQAIDALGYTTAMAYDADGDLQSVTLPNGGTIHYGYDARDRLTQRTDAMGESESWTYDNMGDVASHTDRKGQVTLYSYDALNRRTLVSYSDGTGTQATYDEGDRLTELLDTQSGSLSWRYDDLDRVVSAVTPQGSLAYTYDAAGRRTGMTAATQGAVGYTYDDANRLIGLGQGNDTVSFAYDTANRRTLLTLPNGVTTAYGYDASNELTGMSYAKGDGTALGTLTYSYDQDGRRINQGGTFGSSLLPIATTAPSTFDANNRQTSINGQALSYDANGDLISDGVNTYVWNARHQLVQVKQGGGVRADYTYDALGRRSVTHFAGVAATQYLYDGMNVVQETQGGVANPILTGLGIDERFARNDVTGRTYFLSDSLGSTLALTAASGAILQRYSYDPYGNAEASDKTTGFTNPYQYAGREADGIGLDYYRARYYSPVLGRFISEDPIAFEGGQLNFYAYVNGDPLNYIDPSGLAKHDPSSLYCRNLAVKIKNIGDQLDKRWQELDQGGLPEYIGPGESFYETMRGHRTIINIMDRNRRDLQDKYDDDCGPPPPPVKCPETVSNVKKAAGTAAVLTALYWVISEGSRLFPPRNLVPVP